MQRDAQIQNIEKMIVSQDDVSGVFVTKLADEFFSLLLGKKLLPKGGILCQFLDCFYVFTKK